MYKSKITRLKSAVLSGVIAVTAAVGSMSAAVTSPQATADAAESNNYARLLQYSLYFYDANMCGDNSTGGLSWRSSCHTDDEVPGGFHDAGDHAMFGLPQGFTASTLGWAYYEFGDAFDETGQTAHLKNITNHFCEFFKKSTKLSGDTVTNFLYQKGDGTVDHSYWGPPEKQGRREMFWTSNGASDIAAEYAAALAANYKNFGNAEDLKYAKALYKFSKQYNQAASNQFYGSNSVADDQAWAAGWLYIATGDSSYLNDSKNFPKVGWVHGWNDTHLGAACLYGENAKDWSSANGFISSKAQGSNYMFLDKWGSARLNCSMQFTALVATKHGAGNYTDWAKGQMNYILGNNPANTCFVTGFASNSAKNAHHRAASGYSSYSEFDMNNWNPDGNHMQPFCQYGGNSHTLIGALVGGPCDASGSYHDNMADYICNEVAIDYNAGLVGAAAGLYHFYKTGSIDSNITGVTKIYSETYIPPTTQSTQSEIVTQAPVTTTEPTVTGTPGDGYIEYKANQKVVYEQGMEMIGWEWADLGVGAKDKVSKVEVNISTNKSSLGKWQGAFGTSTTVAADKYWTMTKDMQETFSGNKGTITWEIPSSTSSIIQTQYNGELKFGVWWIDCGEFTIDSIRVYTGEGSTTTGVVTQAPVTTTSSVVTASSGNGYVEYKANQKVVYEQGMEMIGWEWADLGVGAKDKVSKVEVNISTNKSSLGKWQGAFGTSTTVAADKYWTMTKDMQETFSGNKGTITWEIPSSTSSIIQTQYNGELKFGVWWIDCGEFTIDSIKVYTDGSSVETTTTTTTTQAPTTTEPSTFKVPATKLGDANCDGSVNIADAVLVMQVATNPDKYDVGKSSKSITATGKANADVNFDGRITNQDALLIQKFKLGLITSF